MAREDVRERIERRLGELALPISSGQLNDLATYFGLLTKWNERLNLTALPLVPPTDEAIDRLICEPVAASKSLKEVDSLLVDLGSGGGSPAIPLRIMAERARLLMVESKARKCAFLREVVRQLSLADAEVANARFEELMTQVDLRETADVISVRAVRADRTLWGAIASLLKPGGTVLWFAAGDEPTRVQPAGFAIGSSQPLLGSATSRLVLLHRTV